MMGLLRETWGEILFLMGLGGGLWYLLEPPIGAQSGVLSGFVSITILSLALALRSTLAMFSQKQLVPVFLLALGMFSALVAVVLFGNYFVIRSQLIMQYQTGPQQTVEVVRGDTYQPIVLEILKKERKSDSDLLNAAGGIDYRHEVWTKASIWQAERELTWKYLLMALSSLFGAMCFVEILRPKPIPTTGANTDAINAGSAGGSNGV